MTAAFPTIRFVSIKILKYYACFIKFSASLSASIYLLAAHSFSLHDYTLPIIISQRGQLEEPSKLWNRLPLALAKRTL